MATAIGIYGRKLLAGCRSNRSVCAFRYCEGTFSRLMDGTFVTISFDNCPTWCAASSDEYFGI
jgi:hypothetical protein